MATKSDLSAPPSYHSISTSKLPADAIRSGKPSVFSFLKTRRKSISKTPALDKPDSVLSRICDLVSAPDFTPSSDTEIINACAAALPTAEFSDLLQTSNIEGHTALYWAIVNDKIEILSMFSEFISEPSSNCRSDLRLACMTTNNQALFALLGLGHIHINVKDKLLRRSQSGGPLDEIEVHGGDTSKLDDDQFQFVASFRIRMFQKRLRMYNLKYEFVAGGRIWWFHFFSSDKWKWMVGLGLSSPSLPACPRAEIWIEAHDRKKGEPGQETPPQQCKFRAEGFVETHVPDVPDVDKEYSGKVAGTPHTCTIWHLGDWAMHDNPVDVDCEGTLHAKLEMTFKNY